MNKKALILSAALLLILTACGEPDAEDLDPSMPSMTSEPKVGYLETQPAPPTPRITAVTTTTGETVPDMTGTELATTFIDEYGNLYGFTSDAPALPQTAASHTYDNAPSLSDIPDVPAEEYYQTTSSQNVTAEIFPAYTTPPDTVSSSAPATAPPDTGFFLSPETVPSANVSTYATEGEPFPTFTFTESEPTVPSDPFNFSKTEEGSASVTAGDLILTESRISEINEKRISEQNASVKSRFTGKNIVMHPYSYNSLSDTEKYAYDVIVNAMDSYENEVLFPISKKVTFDDLFNAYQCIYTDEVGLFYIDTLMEYITDQSTGYVKNMRLCYTYTDSQVKKMKSEVDSAANAILSHITPDMSDYDIVMLIHDSIIKNCTYTTTGANITNIYGALADENAQCQGYTRAFSYLCSLCGIETDIVLGVATEEHMWNMVQLDGEWYHIDLTWDDPDKKQYPDSVRYDYFCLTTKRISELRTISGNSHVLPSAVSDKYEYYSRNGLVAHNYDEAKNIIMSEAYTVSSKKASTIQFRCADKASYDIISEKLFGNSPDNALSVLEEANAIAPNKFYTDSVYHNSNRNTYTIKLFLDYI